MASEKMKCLGECRKETDDLCWLSGKCSDCCSNECGCKRVMLANEDRYDNLCESKYLRQQAVPE